MQQHEIDSKIMKNLYNGIPHISYEHIDNAIFIYFIHLVGKKR